MFLNMDAMQRHRSMYKGTTPPWKETYRKRCVERLKNSRTRLLQKFRQIEGQRSDSCQRSLLVQEVMEEEWSSLQSSNHCLPSLWNTHDISEVYTTQQEYDDLSAFEDIQQELIAQELSILEECQNNIQYDEHYLNSVLEKMEQKEQIICPLCHQNNLTVNSHFTSCPCGLYINTIGRNITPEVLQNLLERRVTEHMEECLHNPMFFMDLNADRSPNLMLSCNVCDYLSVVL